MDPNEGGGGIYSVLRGHAERLGIKFADNELHDLAAYCLHEWGGAPPEDLNLIRDLFSAYLHYLSRNEEGRAIEATPFNRGRLLKKIRTFFEVLEGDSSIIPYEEFRCPECANTIVVGDLAVVDHYLRHSGQIRIEKSVVTELSDYRHLRQKEKLMAYKVARRFFVTKARP